MVTDSTELYGEITNIELASTLTELTLGAKQYVAGNFGVFAEYTRNDYDLEIINLGVTYKF